MAKHFNFVDIAELRYRKRYDLLQWQKNTSSWLSKPSYDTANGMICCNSKRFVGNYSDSMLRYRERYDLLQLEDYVTTIDSVISNATETTMVEVED